MTTFATDRVTGAEVLDRVQGLLSGIAERAGQAEQERMLPAESAAAFLDAGLARVLLPRRFGGWELGLDVWFDAMEAIGTVDAAHAWCAGLIMHHPHYVAQFPLAAQEAVWADGPDVAMATSLNPTTSVVAVEGGYRLTGEAAWSSGIGHSTWCLIGGMLPVAGPPKPALFLVPKSEYTVRDVWHTTGMRGTGSNVVVTDDVFVPADFALPIGDMLEGTGPGGLVHANPIYRAPMITYAPITFAVPMLGAAKGALEVYRRFAIPRMGRKNATTSTITAQIRMGRAAADIDAAELLLRRSLALAEQPVPASIELRARSMRDQGRAAELLVGAVNDLIALSGTAGFATGNSLQQYWRDVNFAARHVTLNADNNFAYWSTTQLGIARNPAEVNAF
jgi:3-hydroxy-9,10-secoandrosta-1,3,5(10)-triene-9,17-dione monooxygenase